MNVTEDFAVFIKAHKHHLLLAAILLLAFLLYTTNLSQVPPALNQVEAVNGYDALALGTNLRDHHGNFLPFTPESFGDWVSPLLTYLTIPFVGSDLQ